VADLLVRGGLVLTPGGAVEGSVYVEDGRIAELPSPRRTAGTVIDASGRLVVPGLVQAHVHLCQTLFRGLADDLDVVDWLRSRVWPLEQAHDAASMRASARLGIAELLCSGTTTVLSMETTRHTDASFEAAAELGIRAVIGPALMDRWEPGTDMEGGTTAGALESVADLIARWHGGAGGRLGVALSPRGPGNATAELWRACVGLAAEHDLVLHTHVSENRQQAERLAAELGGRDAFVLDAVGALGPRLVMAHCVWLDPDERALVAARGAHVCHCPSANLKLASGVAPIPEYLALGINVALGADGAACNNNLSGFTEMRLAALLHKPRAGPKAIPAATVVDMATMGGARALGLAGQTGSLEVGKRADLVVVARDGLHARPDGATEVVARLAYAHTGADVRDVVVDGQVVLSDGRLVFGSEAEIVAEAEQQRALLLERARLT